MKAILKGLVGFVLVVTALAGILLSLVGLMGVWRIKQPLTANLLAGLELADYTLETTSQGLDVVDQSLEVAQANVAALDTTVLTLAKSISDTVPLVNSLATLAGKDLPTAMMAARTSLIAAQSSTRIMDGVLRSVTAIPFFPGEAYNPPVPLHLALGEVSASLEDLSKSFSGMENSLKMTGGNLGMMNDEVNLMATEIRQINNSLKEAQKVVKRYKALIGEIRSQLDRAEASLADWINLLAWGLSVILLWMAIMQVGLLVQGLQLFT